MRQYGQDTKEGLLELIDKAVLLNELSGQWEKKIDALDASDVKSSMELERKNKAEVIEEDHIRDTITILDRGIQYAQDIKTELEDIEYIDIEIAKTDLSETSWLEVTTDAVKAQMNGETVKKNNEDLIAFQIDLHDEKKFYDKIGESKQNRIYNVQGLAVNDKTITEPKLWNYIRMTDWHRDASKNDVVYAFLERSVGAGMVKKEDKEAAQNQRRDMAKEVKESTLKALVEMMLKASHIDDGISQTKALSDEVEAWFNGLRTESTDKIYEMLKKTEITQTLKVEVDDILATANTNVQEAINEKLNEFMNKMGSSSTPVAGSGSDELFADFDSVSASTFSMNYQEYVMVFLAIRFLATEEEAIMSTFRE